MSIIIVLLLFVAIVSKKEISGEIYASFNSSGLFLNDLFTFSVTYPNTVKFTA